MLRLLLLSALVVAGLVLADEPGDSDSGGGGVFGRIMDPRLSANALRIIGLEKKLHRVKAKLHEAEKIHPRRFLDELLARVDDLEDSHCPERTYQCGGNEQECISDLLVCDGHEDCHNGHDEDDDLCDPGPIKAGNIFEGVSVWHDCLTRNDHITRIMITGTKRRHYFQSRIWVRGLVESVLDEHGHNETSEFIAKGYYNFASRRLALAPADHDDEDHFAVVCEFNYGDDERASCHRIQEASLHECAHLDVELREHHH